MSTDFEDREEEELAQYEEKEEVDWLKYARSEEQAVRPLDGKDYLALFIAAIQTIFLPLIVLVIVFFAINFWLQIVAG